MEAFEIETGKNSKSVFMNDFRISGCTLLYPPMGGCHAQKHVGNVKKKISKPAFSPFSGIAGIRQIWVICGKRWR